MKRMRLVETVGTFSIAEMTQEQKTLLFTEATTKSSIKVFPKIQAIHAGRTRNNTFYATDKLKGDPMLKSGVHSWLYPYRKPMLTHHDRGGEPVGRVAAAEYVKGSDGLRDHILVTAEITDPVAIEKVLDGRYFTVSIGAETDAAICSICGQDIIKDGWCEHERGQEYDGQKCVWMCGNLWFDELSFVNVPADPDAAVVDIAVEGLNESLSSEHIVALSDSFYRRPADVVEYEQKLLDEGVRIDELYNTITTLKANKVTESEIMTRWSELVAAAKKVQDTTGEESTSKVGTIENAEFAHRMMHMWWKDSQSKWPKSMIKKWHTKVVRAITEKYQDNHMMSDSLDATLPADLKKASGGGKKKDKSE